MLLSIGDQVRPGTYRFHSRFNRVVNFENAGRLIAVVDEAIGPGPLNIVLRDFKLALAPRSAEPGCSILKGLNPPAQGWIAGDNGGDPTLGNRRRNVSNPERVGSGVSFDPPLALRISRSTIFFAGHRYHFTSRHRYSSKLELRHVELARFQRNLSVLGDSLKEASPPKSLAFLLDDTRRRRFRASLELAFVEQIRRGVGQVFHGHLLEGVRQLKGCGLGLTPGGDDFIAGFLLGLYVLQRLRRQDLQADINTIARAARGDNIFSNTFLGSARCGRCFGRLKDLLVALTSGNRGSVRRAASALFAVGETSGADLATGLFMTLQLGLGTAARPESSPTQRGNDLP